MVALKKTRMLAFVSLVLSVLSLLLITSCGQSSVVTIDGVYYEFVRNDGMVNEDVWYKLDDGSWSNSDGHVGTYTATGKNIVLLYTVDEEEKEFASGEVSGGDLELLVDGEVLVYVRE